MKASLILAIVACTVAGSVARETGQKSGWYLKGTPGFDYDCSGKVDGNYPHPSKCTHYVACVAGTEAYEMVCATNNDGLPLHYVASSGPDPTTSYCDYPEVAHCEGGDPPAPPTTPAPEDPGKCDPKECQLKGDCQDYWRCSEAGRWEPVEGGCQPDLFWNPHANDLTGGSCDYFNNLEQGIKDEYLADPECILPCAWLQSPEQNCSPNYSYRPEFDGHSTAEGDRVQHLKCSSGAEGDEPLYWDTWNLSCNKCSRVNGQDGNPCGCP